MNWQLANPNDPFYYWHNFNLVRQWVSTHHAHLLSAAQQQTLCDYQLLSKNAQCLWLRCFMRKGTLLKANSLNYPELNTQSAIDELVTAQWLSWTQAVTAPALAIFTKQELTQHYDNARLHTLKKADIIAELSVSENKLPTPLLQLNKNDVFNELSLLFFGNSHQKLSEFVVTALGHVRYEHYPIRATSLFANKQRFRLFCTIEQWQSAYQEATAATSRMRLAKALLNEHWVDPVDAAFEGKISRFINRVARDCERAKENALALALYQRSCRHPARERQARLLKHKAPEQAKAKLKAMHQSPWSAPEYGVAEQLLWRWFKVPPVRPLAPPVERVYELSFTPRKVEQALLDKLCQQGWNGLHAENKIVQALFGLIFWDIIFADINGAFIHPFQRQPRDLTSPTFYLHRQPKIERRLAAMVRKPKAVLKRLRRNIKHKQGLANPFVAWRWQPITEVPAWYQRLPASSWVAIFRQLAFDPKNNASGFPDLWLYQGDQVKLIEVKAPNDKLRVNQQRWLQILASLPLTVEVAQVKPIADEAHSPPLSC